MWLHMATRGYGGHQPNGPRRQRPAKNVTFSRKTLALLKAFADHEEESGRQRPTRTWMLEQGATLFLRRESDRSESFKGRLAELEARAEWENQNRVVPARVVAIQRPAVDRVPMRRPRETQ